MAHRTRFAQRRLGTVMAALLTCSTLAILATASPAAAASFSNASSITTVLPTTCVSPSQPSNPYPSNITVSGQTGTVSDVNVTLHGMNFFEGDFEILLVGPGGESQNLLLLSDAGSVDVTNFTLTFDDAAASVLPQNGSWGSSPRTAKPTDYTEITGNTTDPFPSPAPPIANRPPAATLASVFNGIAPNGTWSLYVVTDVCDVPAETISGGWTLDITTAAGAATTTAVASSVNPSITGNSVTFTATVTSGGNPVTTGTVTFTEGATTLAANIGLNGSGQATFTTSTLPEGNHIITATYNGVLAFNTSNGSVNQRVNNSTVVTGNQLCNNGPITINATPNPATPYPSNIAVSSFATSLGDVNVTLKNITHPYADDIDILLVGPAGQNLVLLSDAAGPPPSPPSTTNVTVTFDDAAGSLVPVSGPLGAAGSSVTYRPTDYDPAAQVDVFPAPAPAPSPATTLATFNGTNPNGTWSLYAVSDGAPETGTIAGGWCITLTPVDTSPPTVTINQAAGQGDPTTTSPINFTAIFSEPVTGFTGADISFTGSTAPGTLVATVTGVGPNYNVAVTGMTGSGTVVASIPAGTVSDLAGNPSLASTSIDNTVTFRRAHQSLPGTVATSTNWTLRNSLTTGDPTNTFTYGIRPPALVPLTGDWDGDGVKTPGIYQSGTFFLRNTNSAGSADITFTFGDPRAFPVSGDFNGDGLDDVALFRGGTWQVRLTGSGTTTSFIFGAGSWPSVVPVAGDWNGDGVDGVGFYCRDAVTCPAGTWSLRHTADAGPANAGVFTYNPGTSPYPVVGDWDADGDDTVGVKTGTTPADWLLNNENDSSAPDITFQFGAANDLPVVWAQ